jgi:hypothetical protein
MCSAMDCRSFQKGLEDYREGTLDFPTRYGMERHAQQCFLCGKDLRDAEALGQASRVLHRVSAPPDFETAVLSRIYRQTSKRVGLARRFRLYSFDWHSPAMLTGGVLCLVVVAFGVLFSINGLSPETSSPGPVIATRQPSPAVPSSTEKISIDPSQIPTVVPATSELKIVKKVSDKRQPTERHSEKPVWTPMQTDQSETEFTEYVVPGPGNRQLIMRLPKTIRMQYAQASEE